MWLWHYRESQLTLLSAFSSLLSFFCLIFIRRLAVDYSFRRLSEPVGQGSFEKQNCRGFFGASPKNRKVYVHFLCLRKQVFKAGVRIPAVSYFDRSRSFFYVSEWLFIFPLTIRENLTSFFKGKSLAFLIFSETSCKLLGQRLWNDVHLCIFSPIP